MLDDESERRRLLSAAMKVLARSGWWGFKVESVLREAALSTRSFYRHFERKSDLLLSLLEREMGGAAENLRRVTLAGATPTEQVHAYLAATIDMAYHPRISKQSALFACHWREMLGEYPDELCKFQQRMIAPLESALQAGVVAGHFRSEDPSADAKAIFCLVAGMVADEATLKRATPRAELENVVMPFVRRAIGLP